MWLLGHIHAPREYRSPGHELALYPGSPWALDPGETGTHGVWIAEFGPDREVTLTSIPISPVRYDTRTVDLTGVEDEDGFQGALVDALNDLGRSAIAAHGEGPLSTVSARLRFTGRSPAHRMVSSWIEKAWHVSPFPMGSIVVEIDAITSEVRPTIQLAQLAVGTDLVAETARLILALDESAPEALYDDLIERTFRDMRNIHELPGYASLVAREPDRMMTGPTKDDVRHLLQAQAWTVLSALVAQREDA